MADEMETADSKASAKVKLAKLFTSEGNLDRSFTLKEFMESTGLSSSKVNVALFSLVQQGVVEQTRDSPPAWSLSSSPRLSRNPSIETSRSEAQTMEMPRVKQEPESAEFSLEYDLQTQISFLLNSKNRAISFDEICHFVARSTDDHQVVSDCLKTLEHYQLVRRYRDNPLLWIAVGNELATEHHYKPNECIPSRDTDESIVTVNQSAALVNLKDYPSPQGSPVDSKHESVHQNISSEHSSSSPNEDQNQEPSGAKETSRNILPVECNKERKAHQETEIKPVSSLKTLPPPPSSILFQNLKEEVPDLNPVMASGHPHVDLDNDATTQHSEEQSDKHTPYQEAYLILEMGTDYNRLMEDSYDDNTDNVFQEDEGQRECYKDKDEREIHQANLQQDCGGRLVEFLQRSEDNKLNNRLVLTSSENKAVFGHLNEQERKDNRPCTSFSDLGHGQKKEAQEDEGAPHREVIEKQQMPQLIKKLDEKTRMSTELTTDNPMSNLQNTNQTIHTVQSTVKKAPSSAPPPPSAALFQSLMSKCTRPPAPVVMKPAQSQQFHPLGSGPSQLRTPTSRGAVPSLMSLQVNKNYSQHHTSVVPYTSSSIAKGNQIRQSTQLSANSLIKQNREGQSGVTEFTSASGSIRDDTRPSSGTPGVNPSSSLAFTRQSTSPPSNLLFTRQSTSPLRNLPFSRQSTSPPSNFSSQNNSKSVYTAAASKLPAPPSANLFQNLVKRGPQTLAANSSKSVMSKQPAKLNAQESQLIDYMKQEKKPCQVLQLARVFGFRTKKEINPTLYHLQSLGLIYKLHDHPPTWKLRPTTGSYDVHPPHKPSGTSEMLGSLLTKDTANRISHGEVTFRQPTVFPEYEGAPQKRKWDHAAAVPSSKIFEPVFSQEVLNKPNYPSYEHQDTHPLSRQPYIQPIPSSGVSSSQVLNKVTFSAINKNPVSTLNEYAQKNNMAVTFELIRQGRGNRPCFEVAAKVGSQTFPSVTASNMKDARREAADLAMRTILGKAAQGSESSQPGEFRMIQTNPGGLPGVRTHFDLMAALSHHAFLQIAAAVPDKFAGRKVIACMIMKPTLEDSGHVVSLGAGNRCVTGQRLSMEGKTVNDSHAEIVSRRALLRFLYGQLDNFYTGKDSIFESSTKSSKLRARQGVSFHLYISTAPCGDGALFTPREISSLEPSQIERQHSPTFTNKQQGILRTKIEDGEGTIPIDPSEGPQTWDGLLQGCRLRTMSCSDKICRWNILGLQGSLLSHLIEPIYLESLTLGYLYDHGHLSRAVCCRLQHKSDLNADVQQPYHVNHPWLGRVTAYDAQRETEKTNNLSVNWTIGDTTVEVTDGRTGACMARTGNSPTPSRLCKASLYAMFKDICAKAGGKNELLNAETYRDAKAMATDFQETKKKFYSYLQKSKYGQWVSKPLEQEQF